METKSSRQLACPIHQPPCSHTTTCIITSRLQASYGYFVCVLNWIIIRTKNRTNRVLKPLFGQRFDSSVNMVQNQVLQNIIFSYTECRNCILTNRPPKFCAWSTPPARHKLCRVTCNDQTFHTSTLISLRTSMG